MAMQNTSAPWLADVKEEAFRNVADSPLTKGCAEGKVASLFALLIGFWPFVDSFPKITRSKYSGTRDLKAKILAKMESDERGHRALWLQTCAELGITPQKLGEHGPLPRMQRLISVIGEDTDLPVSFLRFLGIEIVAEAVSEGLIQHIPFQEALGGERVGLVRNAPRRPERSARNKP